MLFESWQEALHDLRNINQSRAWSLGWWMSRIGRLIGLSQSLLEGEKVTQHERSRIPTAMLSSRTKDSINKCEYAYTYICIHMCICICIYVYIYMSTCLRRRRQRHIHVYTFIYTYLPTYLPSYLPTYLHTYLHTYTYLTYISQ